MVDVKKRKLKKGGGSKPPSAFSTPKEVRDVLDLLGKKHSKGTVRLGSDCSVDYGRLRSGILSLDIALGGGLLLSRAHMIYGERSAGKSTLAAMFCAEAQLANPKAVIVWVDVEGTFDRKWAEKLGIDLERLYIIEPSSGEEAVDIVDAFVHTDGVSLIVVDSIAALTPYKEIQDSAEDANVALQARLIGKLMRKVGQGIINERKRDHPVTVVYLNQFRLKVGLTFGDPRVLPGGKSIEYFMAQQIEIKNKENVAAKGDLKGIVTFNDHTFKITKNKTGGRLTEGKYKLIRDESEDRPVGYVEQTKTMLSFAREIGWYTGGGQAHKVRNIGTFKSHDELSEYLLKHEDKRRELYHALTMEYCKKWDIL